MDILAIAEKLGKKKIVVPFVFVIVLALVFPLMLYPMTNMELRDLPFAIVNLDEGAELPTGKVNMGDQMAEKLMNTAADENNGNKEGEDSSASDMPIKWIEMTSRSQLDQALEDNELYGAVIIPANFTLSKVSDMMEEVEGAKDAKIQVVLDMAKSPMIANQMSASIESLFTSQGMETDVEIIHQAETTSESGNSLTTVMGLSLGVTPIFMMILMGSLLISQLVGRRATNIASRFKGYLAQIALMAAVSFLIGCVGCLLQLFVLHMDVNAGSMLLFYWLAAFCVMLMFMGLSAIKLPLGAVIGICCMLLGMTCAMIPFEALPQFWQDFVWPWSPQHYISQGLSQVLYMKTGAWNASAGALMIYACIGFVSYIIAAFIPRREKKA